MIGVQLKGLLGNQMFQYAVARTLADRLGCPVLTAGYTIERRLGLVGHWLGWDAYGTDPAVAQYGLQRNGVLHATFGCGSTFARGRLAELAMPFLRRSLFRRSFTLRRFAVGKDEYEVFDPSWADQRAWTWLDGWFQSEGYFAENASAVRQWFRLTARHQRQLDELKGQLPAPASEMVAIHVRRGDYAAVRDGVSDPRQGWQLPMSYYTAALAEVPKDAPLAVFSDDPQWAADAFAARRPWVSRNNSAGVDMMLIASCRWNIIANSSFSWWAGWLNSNPDKVVIAPRYHLGWHVTRWVPGGIEVPGWNYIAAQ